MNPFSGIQTVIAVGVLAGFAWLLWHEALRRRWYRQAFLHEAAGLGLVPPPGRGQQASAGDELASLGVIPRYSERKGLHHRHVGARRGDVLVIDALLSQPDPIPPRMVGGATIEGWDERRLAELGRSRLVAALAEADAAEAARRRQ